MILGKPGEVLSRRRGGARAGLPARLILGFFAPLFVADADAAPWPRSKGGVFFESKVERFVAEARGPTEDRIVRYESSFYGEYGLTESVLIGGKAVLGTTRFESAFEATRDSGLTEFEGFAQKTFYRGAKDVASLRFAAARPASLQGGARPGLAAEGLDLDFRALYGRDFEVAGLETFATIETAFRKRIGDAADQARCDALIGFKPSQRWMILLEAQNTVSLSNGDGGADFDLVRIQPSLVWRGGRRWALRAGGAIEVATRNLTPGDAAFVAVWVEF